MSIVSKLVSFVSSDVISENNVQPLKIEPKKEFEFKEKVTKEQYLGLKAEEKTYAKASRALRLEAVKSKGLVRSNLRSIKKQHGSKARLYHIAVGFLKGRRYSEMEQNVKPENKLTAEAIKHIIYLYCSSPYRKFIVDNKEVQKFLES